MRYISQGRMDILPQCPRKYWLSYCADQDGYDGSKFDIRLYTGIVTHKGLEAATKANDLVKGLEAIAGYPLDQKHWFECTEAQRLALALTIAWYDYRLPIIQQQYEILEIEYPVMLPITPTLTLMGRVDMVLKEKSTGLIWAYNWKTTNSLKDWDTKFFYDIQAWTEAFAYEQEKMVEVVGVLYEGLYKGSVYNGQPTSVLLCKGAGKLRTQVPIEKLVEHISSLPQVLIEEQFALSLPVFKNTEVVEQWLDELAHHEADIDYVMGLTVTDQLQYFQRRRGDQCKWCPFRPNCWEGMSIGEMLKYGIIRKRETPITQANQEEVASANTIVEEVD